jgi:PST family polysaccharide transporter
MTSLNICSTLIGILLYPYLIRTLGKDSYGLYVFSFSVVKFFMLFVAFGFFYPAMKEIIENRNDIYRKQQTLSAIFTAKMILLLFASVIFSILCFSIPLFRNNYLIFVICYAQIIADIIFPAWYFQAVQKMKFVTVINLIFRLLTIPLIFIFIKNPNDTLTYALIISLSVIIGSFSGVYLLWKEEKVYPKFLRICCLKKYFQDSLPFFWSYFASTIKSESITLIIGAFFNMADVALYDLANKIVSLPRTLTLNINSALFPKALAEKSTEAIRKIIRYETFTGIACFVGILIFGYWIVLLLGGKSMLAAYPLTVIISTTILSWLVVGAYIDFIFVPKNRYYFVTKNQFVAFFSFFIIISIGLLLCKNILVLAIAYSLSGFCEIIYCKYLIRKYRLL